MSSRRGRPSRPTSMSSSAHRMAPSSAAGLAQRDMRDVLALRPGQSRSRRREPYPCPPWRIAAARARTTDDSGAKSGVAGAVGAVHAATSRPYRRSSLVLVRDRTPRVRFAHGGRYSEQPDEGHRGRNALPLRYPFRAPGTFRRAMGVAYVSESASGTASWASKSKSSTRRSTIRASATISGELTGVSLISSAASRACLAAVSIASSMLGSSIERLSAVGRFVRTACGELHRCSRCGDIVIPTTGTSTAAATP